MFKKMEMCLVSSTEDVVALKTPYCKTCAEKKLSLTILGTWPITSSEYNSIRSQIVTNWKLEKVQVTLRGVLIRCEC